MAQKVLERTVQPGTTYYSADHQHHVVRDGAGLGGGYLRYTCKPCNDATLVRQPFMDHDRWAHELQQFEQQHGPAVQEK